MAQAERESVRLCYIMSLCDTIWYYVIQAYQETPRNTPDPWIRALGAKMLCRAAAATEPRSSTCPWRIKGGVPTGANREPSPGVLGDGLENRCITKC